MVTTAAVEGIFIAGAARETLAPVAEVRAVEGRGLEGDRYHAAVGSFSRWPGEGRAVTLVEAEVIEAILRDWDLDLSGGRSRRNLVTRGVRLADLLGRRFRIGKALFRGTRLAAPCAHLERLTEPGVFEALKGRGGLRADVLESGVIRAGDAVVPEEAVRP
jgi:MOSC domain-containing protein YiiM